MKDSRPADGLRGRSLAGRLLLVGIFVLLVILAGSGRILAQTPATAISEVTLSNFTFASATATVWIAGTDGTARTVYFRHRREGATAWTDANQTTADVSAAFTLTGLSPASDYTAQASFDSTFSDGAEITVEFQARPQDKDFALASGNGRSRGIWSDGSTLWVVNDDIRGTDRVYAYNMGTKAHDPAQSFSVGGGNGRPAGIYGNSSTLWVSDTADDSVYAYTITAGGSYGDLDTAKGFALDGADGAIGPLMPTGLWSDGSTLWTAGHVREWVYAYNIDSTGTFGDRVGAKGFDLATEYASPRGVWSDGSTLWVADSEEGRIFAYDIASGGRRPVREIRLVDENDEPWGVWSDGSTLWVTDAADDKVYAYSVPPAPGGGVTGAAFDRIALDEADITVTIANPTSSRKSVVVAYRTVSGGSATTSSASTNGSSVTFNLSGLDEATDYTLTVRVDSGDVVHTGGFSTKSKDDVIEENLRTMVVEEYEADYPWVREAYNAMREASIPIVSGTISGGKVELSCLADRCSVLNYTMGWSQRSNLYVLIHELAHVITNGLAYERAEHLGMGWLYINELADGKDACNIPEFYADAVTWATRPEGSLNYILHCRWAQFFFSHEIDIQALKVPSATTLEVMESILDADIPTWFDNKYAVTENLPYDTSADEKYDRQYDLEAVWRDVGLMDLFDSPSARYSFRDSFGGYCPHHTRSNVRNPWRVGGCIPRAPKVRLRLLESSVDVSWSVAYDGGSPATYQLEWRNTEEDFEPSRSVEMTDLGALPHSLPGYGLGMSVRVTARNQNGSGPATTEYLMTRVGTFSLHSDNTAPRGITGNDDTIWVLDDNDDTIFAYSRLGQRLDTKTNFASLDSDFASDGTGICANSTHVHLVDRIDDRVYPYRISDRRFDSAGSFSLGGGNGAPQGAWCTDEMLWVVNNNGTNSKVFAYHLTDDLDTAENEYGTRAPSADIDGIGAASVGNGKPFGLWADGDTMFTVDRDDDKVYAFRMSDGTHNSSLDITLDPENSDPQGLWFDGRVMWVVDIGTDKVYAYDLPELQASNTPATGGPVITGAPTVGNVLTADISAIDDSDGFTDLPRYYQWVRVDGDSETEISRAVRKTYTPTSDDVGHHLRVRVIFDDGAGYLEYPKTSGEVGPVSPNSPATGGPSIVGILQRDETLTADTAGIADADGLGTFSYQWLADGADISEATSSAYTLASAQVGEAISVRVSFTDGANGAEVLTSASTGAVVASGAVRRLLWLGTLTVRSSGGVSGYSSSGGALSPAAFDYGGTTYSLSRLDSHPGAGVLYFNVHPAPEAAEVGKWAVSAVGEEFPLNGANTVTAAVTNPAGTSFQLEIDGEDFSSWTDATQAIVALREPVNAAPTGVPTLLGGAQVGERLTAIIGGISDPNGVRSSLDFQWMRNGTDITEANDNFYIPVTADVGSTIKVEVSFTDGDGFTENLVSAPTAAVTAVDNVLVKNTAQSAGTVWTNRTALSQAFTTGAFTMDSERGVYEVNSVSILYGEVPENTTVTLNSVDSNSHPGAAFCTLAHSESHSHNGLNTFVAPSDCPVLAAATTYSVVVRRGGTLAGTGIYKTYWTAAENEDSSSAAGWSIADSLQHYRSSQWTEQQYVLLIRVRGVFNESPTVSFTDIPDTVNGGGAVTLDGTAADAENDTLSYAWASSGGGTFGDASALDTTWTAPAATTADQTVTLTLTVTDTATNSASAMQDVTVRANQAPTVSFTDIPDTVNGGGAVTLDGTAADAENDTLSYAWASSGGGTFGDASALDSTWTAPAATTADQTVTLTLTVTDDGAGTRSASAMQDVTVRANQAPTASATVTAEVLVKNTARTATGSGTPLTSGFANYAQRFTTGANAAGYTLHSISVKFKEIGRTSTAGSALTVTLNAENSGSGSGSISVFAAVPWPGFGTSFQIRRAVGSALCTLTDPPSFSASGAHTFSAPTTGTDLCPTLAASTAYFVVIARANSNAGTVSLDATTTRGGDSGGAMGWSIENGAHYFEPSFISAWLHRSAVPNLMIGVSGRSLPETVAGGGTVTLDGTAADAENDTLSYAWASSGGGTFADASALDTTWTAPAATDTAQNIVLTLTVTDDGAGARSASDTVDVTVLGVNESPTVSFTVTPDTVAGGGAVALDGTAADAENDALSYAWASSGGGTFADASALDTTWTAPAATTVDQSVTLTLTVTDTATNSASAMQDVTVLANQAPTVSAEGSPETVAGGGAVALDGTAADAENDALSYAWASSGGGTFADASALDTTWTAPAATTADQTVTLTLTVTDDGAGTRSASAMQDVTVLANQAPTASAEGSPETVAGGGAVALDGTAADAENDALSYAWASSGGGTFADASALDTTWTAPAATAVDQSVTLTLTVTDDGAGARSASDTVDVTVLGVNESPTVSFTVTPDTVAGGGAVALDGTAADAENDALSYAWASSGGGTFADASALDTTWTAPAATTVDQSVTLTLTVTDTATNSASAMQDVTVLANQAPTVSAEGSPETVAGGGAVALDGTAADAENDALSYAWASSGGGTFADASALDTTWTAPAATAVDQSVTLTLTVTDDGAGARSASDTVDVTVLAVNESPTVSFTVTPDTVNGGGAAALDGTAADAENDALSYAWASSGGGTFADASALDTTWTAPAATTADQTVTLTLTVTDDGAGTRSASAMQDVTVLANQAPTASAEGSPETVAGGGAVALDGTAADAENDALSYAWASSGGGTFADASALDTTWTAPAATDMAQNIVLTLTVTDDGAGTAAVQVTVSVFVEPANAARDLQATVGGDNSVSLSWTLPSPSDTIFADLQVQQSTGTGDWTTVATLPHSATSHTIEGLEAATTFYFRIRLTSTEGVVADSLQINVRTARGAPAPRHFAADWPTQTSITLSWFTLETAAEYKPKFRKQGDSEWTRISGDFDHLPSTSDNRRATAVAAGLDCNTQYDFRVSARGDDSRYPSSFFGSAATTSTRTGKCAQEEQVANLLVSIEPACAILTWTPPSGDRDTGYRVERYTYTGRDTSEWQVSGQETLVEQPTRVATTYDDCSAAYRTAGAEHVYTVSALDDEGEAFGFAHTSLLVYGPNREPEEPRNVRFTRDTQHSRRLEWDAPPGFWLTTVKTAHAASGQQRVKPDPWTTGYRVERREYRTDEHGDWVLPEFEDETLWTATMMAGGGGVGGGTDRRISGTRRRSSDRRNHPSPVQPPFRHLHNQRTALQHDDQRPRRATGHDARSTP